MRENRLKQCNVFIKRGCLAEPVELVVNWINWFLTLPTDSSKNKESNKKNGAQFWARMRENRLKQCNVFIKRGCLVEPVEPVSNQCNWLIKILIIYQKIPQRTRNPTKKERRSIPSLDEGELAKTRQHVYKIGLVMQGLLNRFPTDSSD